MSARVWRGQPDPELADYLFGHISASDPRIARLVADIRGQRP